ncbi:hypothetical protein BDV96DRAFT_642664 [Lophiotrema nucula]|uniref:Uncharacterized protein n=1 Tax=Lophiotrema nucula TaxID=690887 RepID=A0A6A5ZLC2_9PLEO|nr:hypothetical protein BDV96DRAFT_642664 [Lophiotrema nucula]
MSYTVGDFLFFRLAEIGVQQVLGNRRASLFIGSCQRNNIDYRDFNHLTSTPNSGNTGTFIVSRAPEDLHACYNRGNLFFPHGSVLYIVEHSSAQFEDSFIASHIDFAIRTVLNSPATAESQINRAIDTLLFEGKPVYIGLSPAVAGLLMPMSSPSQASTSSASATQPIAQTSPRSQSSNAGTSTSTQAATSGSPSGAQSQPREVASDEDIDEAAKAAVAMSLI